MSQGLTLPSGYHIRFKHWRIITKDDGSPLTLAPYRRGQSKWGKNGPHPRGGATVATVYNYDGKEIVAGMAGCSMLDAFSYKIGMAISGGRALKKLQDKLQLPNEGAPEPLPRPFEPPRLPYLWVGDSKYTKVLD